MKDSLDRYFEVMQEAPQLFLPRVRRKLILDRKLLDEWSKTNGVNLGVLAETPFFLFIYDLVKFDDGAPHPYSRLVSKKSLEGQNSVVILPVIRAKEGERVILILQERHALGKQVLEIPRGFAEPGVDELSQARNELESETGYTGTPIFLGTSYSDSGTTDNLVSFYLIRVEKKGVPHPEVTEQIERIVEMPLDAVRQHIGTDLISDGYTIQALGLYDRYLNYGSSAAASDKAPRE